MSCYCLLSPPCQVDLVKSLQAERNLTRGQWDVLATTLQKSTMFYSCCEAPFPHITLRMLLQRNAPALAYTVQIPALGRNTIRSTVWSYLALIVKCLFINVNSAQNILHINRKHILVEFLKTEKNYWFLFVCVRVLSTSLCVSSGQL